MHFDARRAAAFAKREARLLTVAAICLVIGFYRLLTDGSVALPIIGFGVVFVGAAVAFDRSFRHLHKMIDEAYPSDEPDGA